MAGCRFAIGLVLPAAVWLLAGAGAASAASDENQGYIPMADVHC